MFPHEYRHNRYDDQRNRNDERYRERLFDGRSLLAL